MTLSDILSPSFESILKAVPKQPTDVLWKRCLSIGSQFCEAVVGAGYLSWEQMVNASCRYCLGCSSQGGVIFWQIDQEGRVHDGKVMYYRSDCHRDKDRHPTWVSSLLCRRYHWRDCQQTSHCLFGLHLLSEKLRVKSEEGIARRPEGKSQFATAVVEAEKTAVIMSELCPQYIWLAAGGLWALQPDLFRPLRGRKVILFPDTDPDLRAYTLWYNTAQQVMKSFLWPRHNKIIVSDFLERNASAEQKQRKIDLVDYILESNCFASEKYLACK